MMKPVERFPEELLDTLRSAAHVVVLTGAGISKESGIPTFREAQTGLWAQYEPAELATPAAFRRQPQLVWEWYQWRRKLVEQATPNPAHIALAEMEQRVPHFTLITQNVDGLHRAAGSQNVLELHGNISRYKCFAEDTQVTEWEPAEPGPPRCPRCGSYLRPDVVWFGESLPFEILQAAVDAARNANVLLSVGTSGLVHPAAGLPFEALERGIPVAEVNPERTPLSPYVDFLLQGEAGALLPAIVRETWAAGGIGLNEVQV